MFCSNVIQARVAFGDREMALLGRLFYRAVSDGLVGDRTSWDSGRLEIFLQSQDLPANPLIHWVRLCSFSYLASASHFPFPYGHACIWSRARICTPGFTLLQHVSPPTPSGFRCWERVHVFCEILQYIIRSPTPYDENNEPFLILWVTAAAITASNAADSSCFHAVTKDWLCTVSFLCHALTPPSACRKAHLFTTVTG